MSPTEALSRDEIFLRFMVAMAAILMLFGIAMVATIFVSSDSLVGKMVAAFASMFSGLLGLGAGYMLGTSNPPGSETP